MVAMQQLRALADKVNMQITQLSNQRHAFSQSRLASEEAIHLIDSMIKVLAGTYRETPVGTYRAG
jgi:hypothetical protein